jgi:hypothetical protein
MIGHFSRLSSLATPHPATRQPTRERGGGLSIPKQPKPDQNNRSRFGRISYLLIILEINIKIIISNIMLNSNIINIYHNNIINLQKYF